MNSTSANCRCSLDNLQDHDNTYIYLLLNSHWKSSKTIQTKFNNLENMVYRILFKGNELRRSTFNTRELTKKRICLQVLNCLQRNTCENFQNYFDVMNNQTRNKNYILRIPRVKLESCKKSYFFNGAKEYNELPTKIISAQSNEEFLKLYKEVFNL